MEEKKNKIFRGQLPVSVIYVLLGLCLALMPVETVNQKWNPHPEQ